jgi:hypothetical protein
MDKNDVQQALLEAAHRAASLADGAIDRAGRGGAHPDGNAVVEVEGFANAAKALAEAAEVTGRA